MNISSRKFSNYKIQLGVIIEMETFWGHFIDEHICGLQNLLFLMKAIPSSSNKLK